MYFRYASGIFTVLILRFIGLFHTESVFVTDLANVFIRAITKSLTHLTCSKNVDSFSIKTLPCVTRKRNCSTLFRTILVGQTEQKQFKLTIVCIKFVTQY